MLQIFRKLIIEYLNPVSSFVFLINLVRNRWLLAQLTRQDFKQRFATSVLGGTWAFIQPIMTMIVLWFVLEYGFQAGSMLGTDIPYILWFMTGILPWFLFADAFTTASNSILEKSYLVKKVVFQVSILPLVKILTAYVVHLVSLVFLFLIFRLYQYTPGIHAIQIFYYMFAMLVFLVGLTWISSSVSIFAGDVSHLLNILIQIGFWATPIMWNLDTMFEGNNDRLLKHMFELNPVYYIVQGYRNSLINDTWFWEHLTSTLFFWGLSLVTLALGTILFKRLRPHFADLL